MDIRSATEEDYSELMQLYNLFVEEDRYSTYKNDSFGKVLKSPTNFIFVAEENGKLIGFVTFSVRNVIRYSRQIAELDEIFVLSEYREKNIGKQLMEKVEEKAKKLDCFRIYIESAYDKESAHKFYEAIGYKNNGYHFKKNL